MFFTDFDLTFLMSREILLWEYLSGGGLVNSFLTSSLLCEGVAMLRAIAYDFAQAGFQLTILLDKRLLSLKRWLPSSRFVPITREDDLREVLKHEATRAGAFFIIAPEFDSILFSFTNMLEDIAHNWGCSSKFIKIFGNKWDTWNFWKSRGVTTPPTWQLPPTTTKEEVIKILQSCDNTIIIKPASGAGAENIFSCSLADMQNAHYSLAVMKKISDGGCLAQKFIPGIACSANFVVVQKEIKVLCVNDQIVELGTSPEIQSRYMGGISPAQTLLKYLPPQSIQKALQPLIESFPSPESGLFGIDFICDPSGVLYFIEVNSRLTTSYVALARILAQNPISLMLDGNPPSLGDVLHNFNEIIFYRKLDLYKSHPTARSEVNVFDLPEIPALPKVEFACPPLLDSYGHATCFISIAGRTCKIIAQDFSAIKEFLSRHFD